LKIVSTKVFWKYMSKAGFRRTGLLTGTVYGELIVTLEPPDDTDITNQAIKDLKGLLKI